MSNVAVIYHSGYGHTAKQAEAVTAGAKGDLIAIDANGDITGADWAKLDAAKAIIMGSPTYMGGVVTSAWLSATKYAVILLAFRSTVVTSKLSYFLALGLTLMQ